MSSPEAAAAQPAAEAPTSIPSTPVVTATTTTDAAPDKEPSWLAARLERERTATLKAVGFDSADDAKASKEELKKRRDAEKSETERLKSENVELAAKAKRVDELAAVVDANAKAELASLTESQRAGVLSIAGDDAGLQLKAIAAMRPTWATAPATATTKPVAAPATTAPVNAAPSPANATASPSHLATWERLKETNPVQAAHYLVANQHEIAAERTTRR